MRTPSVIFGFLESCFLCCCHSRRSFTRFHFIWWHRFAVLVWCLFYALAKGCARRLQGIRRERRRHYSRLAWLPSPFLYLLGGRNAQRRRNSTRRYRRLRSRVGKGRGLVRPLILLHGIGKRDHRRYMGWKEGGLTYFCWSMVALQVVGRARLPLQRFFHIRWWITKTNRRGQNARTFGPLSLFSFFLCRIS